MLAGQETVPLSCSRRLQYFLPADQAAPAANDVKVVSKLAKLETVVSH